ncbi:SPASM domain-containing protein [Thermococcus sp. 101 C5]|uniref:SPASM domain-containing protein n=1 Tax=Thermococcus sp. 101 C5 TaxID=2654197 RepID=UPI001320A9EA|nr:SPASM domain-containing protein [Thermococcus sp. 101 C5]
MAPYFIFILYSYKATKFINKTKVEYLPHCSSCVFRYICGGGCRANAFATCGRIDGMDIYNCEIVKLTFPAFIFSRNLELTSTLWEK